MGLGDFRQNVRLQGSYFLSFSQQCGTSTNQLIEAYNPELIWKKKKNDLPESLNLKTRWQFRLALHFPPFPITACFEGCGFAGV